MPYNKNEADNLFKDVIRIRALLSLIVILGLFTIDQTAAAQMQIPQSASKVTVFYNPNPSPAKIAKIQKTYPQEHPQPSKAVVQLRSAGEKLPFGNPHLKGKGY